jgi:hypothetical protein
VKTLCADASVDFVDVKVGHCQALNLMKTQPSPVKAGGGFFVATMVDLDGARTTGHNNFATKRR